MKGCHDFDKSGHRMDLGVESANSEGGQKQGKYMFDKRKGALVLLVISVGQRFGNGRQG